MENIVMPLIIINIVGSFLCSFLESGSKLSKYVGYASALCIVCMVISPIFSLFNYIGDLSSNFSFDYDMSSVDSSASLEKLMLENADVQLKKSVANIINAKFSLALCEDSISFVYDSEDMNNISIKKITVDTSDSFLIRDLYEIKYLVEDYFMCECEVR